MTDKPKGVIGDITIQMIAAGCAVLQKALGDQPWRRDEPNLTHHGIITDILWAALDGYAVVPMEEYEKIAEAADEHETCGEPYDDYD